MKRFLFIVIFLCFMTPKVFAEEIKLFLQDITIQQNGIIQVQETIQYDFGSLEKHGIFRIIPLIKTNPEGKKFRMSAKGINVLDEQSNRYPYKDSSSNEEISLKIGDPNKTVSGLHNYLIRYSLGGALTYFSDHDELYFNSTGNEWNVPIYNARTVITLPTAIPAEFIKTACYTGPNGSTNQACTSEVKGQTVTIQTTQPLQEHEGLTFVLSLPKDTVAVLEPTPVTNVMDNPIMAVIIGIAVLVVSLSWYIFLPMYIGYRWWKYGRDPAASIGQAHVWFAPPKTMQKRDLTPGEVGTLVDETVNPKDIAATIVDLARRRYITIKEETTGLFRTTKYSLIKEPEPKADHLQPFEKILLDEIFSVEDVVETSDSQLYSASKKVEAALYEAMVKEKFFPENPETTRTIYSIVTVVALITFNPLLFIASLIFGRNMPKKTVFGVDQATIGKALQTFLISQDTQYKFQAEKQIMFEKMLPYAVAFGVEKIWAKRFEDITLTQPDWYRGNSFSNPVLFTNHLTSSISSMNAAMTPTKSSSGFSSGFGGSSGGGGGGGGGGSW